MPRTKRHIWMTIDVDGKPARIKAAPDISPETLEALKAAIRAMYTMFEQEEKAKRRARWFAHQEWIRAAAGTLPGSTLSQPDEEELMRRVVNGLVAGSERKA